MGIRIRKLRKCFWWRPHRDSRFDLLMARAEAVAARDNVEGLRDLIKIIMRPVQAKHIAAAYYTPDHHAPEELGIMDLMGMPGYIPGLGFTFRKFVQYKKRTHRDGMIRPLYLATDCVLPTSWHPSSIVANLGRIGEGLPNGAFQQSSNHSVVVMVPMDIGWVEGGNHSIAQGIIRGEGAIIPDAVVDVTPVMQHVRYDGEVWRGPSEEYLGMPRYEELGWAWEIARYIVRLQSSHK